MMMKLFSTMIVGLLTLVAGNNGNLEYDLPEYEVKVTGQQNVPKYFFTDKETNSTFKIMYQKIYETDEDGNKLQENSFSLPSLNWEFEQDEEDENSFVIRALPKNRDLPWDSLEFKNTLFNSTVKFDVSMTGYTWGSDDATKLNIAWKFTSEDDDEDEDDTEEGAGEEPETETATEFCFGDGSFCFDIVDTADILDSDGNVTATTDVELMYDGEVGVTVQYNRWEEGDLYHDPSFGIGDREDAEDGEDNDCDGLFGAIACFLGGLFFCF